LGKYKAELDEKLAKNYRLSPKELFPWHYHDPFFQEAPRAELDLDGYYKGKDLVEIARDFFKEVGLPADDILARSDLYEREKKSQHAFCSCLDRQQDVRILCNMRENEYWMGTLLHELGHGVYDKYIDQTLPYLLRTYAHISTTEASAMLFGRFSKNGDFLQKYCGVDEKEAKRIDLLAKQQTAATLLVFARWALVMVHFERAMYQKPGIDLRSFWWDCVERFQGVKRVPKRNAPDWASKLHLACAPVYYQNYALGEMTASQLFYHIQRVLKAPKESFCNSGKVGKFLQAKLFSQGAKRPWEETLMAATGDKLDSKYFAEDIIHIKNK
jgi:peptidyl-dipeptidase A